MESLKLIAAIAYIQSNQLIKGDYITQIQFEDGSHTKFNYTSSAVGILTFIDLTGKI